VTAEPGALPASTPMDSVRLNSWRAVVPFAAISAGAFVGEKPRHRTGKMPIALLHLLNRFKKVMTSVATIVKRTWPRLLGRGLDRAPLSDGQRVVSEQYGPTIP
jgi:hypothetical protein